MRPAILFLILASLAAAAPLDSAKLNDQNVIAQSGGQKDLAQMLKADGKTVNNDLQGRVPHHNKVKAGKDAPHSGDRHREKGGEGRHGGEAGSHRHHEGTGNHEHLGKIPDLEVDGHSGVGHDRHGHKSVLKGSKAGHARSHEDHEYTLANALGKDTTFNDLRLDTTVGHVKHHHSREEQEYTLAHTPTKDKTINDLDADVMLGDGKDHDKRDQHDYTIGPLGGLVVDLSFGHDGPHKRYEGEYDLAHAPVDDKTLNDLDLDLNVGHSKYHSRGPQDDEQGEEMWEQSDDQNVESRELHRDPGQMTNDDILDTDVKLEFNGHRFPN